jgi:hypothetical protein
VEVYIHSFGSEALKKEEEGYSTCHHNGDYASWWEDKMRRDPLREN